LLWVYQTHSALLELVYLVLIRILLCPCLIFYRGIANYLTQYIIRQFRKILID